MISDSTPKAPAPLASSNPRDFAKKKRGNRSAKLKQCKLDARREQWLSQVKNKGGRNEVTNGGWDVNGDLGYLESERSMPLEKLELKLNDNKQLHGSCSSEHHFSDSESSPLNSPTSHSSSTLGSNDSGLHFSTSMRSSVRSGRSSSSSSGFFSSEMSAEDYGDAGEDDCLDDWEIMADALAAAEVKDIEQEHSSGFVSSHSEKHDEDIGSQLRGIAQPPHGTHVSCPEKQSEESDVVKAHGTRRAWRPDDAFRPQSLPTLSKQYSSLLNSNQHFREGYALWASGSVPTSCPICCEDLDCTDSSFTPCPCGFTMCLFCHKRILEDDGRCPGCRKQYAS